MHQGMTSSDVLDTCFNVQLARAADILIADVDKLLAALKRRAFEHKLTPTIGRSHGIHAEPTTFGLKLARPMPNSTRAERASSPRARRSRPARSPAPSAPSPISIRASKRMSPRAGAEARAGLDAGHPARPPCRCIFATLGVIASSVERLATEIRHLQRTEVLEAEEYSRRGRRAPRRCRTSAIRCCPKT